jgi:hypothetical protein
MEAARPVPSLFPTRFIMRMMLMMLMIYDRSPQVVAVGASALDKAQDFAKRHQIPRRCGPALGVLVYDV